MGKDLKGKELGENICQRKNGSYCARYLDKFGERKSIYDKDLRALKKKLAQAIYEDKNGLNIIDKKITLDQWYEKWMLVYKSETIRPSTKIYYSHVYKKHISPVLGMLPICEITKLQIQALLNKVKRNGYQWETQNKVRILLIDMFNRALEDCFIVRNPARGARLASCKPKDERKVLTLEEQALFFECSAGTFYDNMFVVAVNTGLRPGELFALTWDDIDLENHMLSVTKTLSYQKFEGDDSKTFHLGPPKTESSVRKVPINSICERALKKQYIQKNIIAKRNIRQTDFKDLLFTTKFNTPINAEIYCDAIKRIIDEINLTKDDLEQIDKFGGHSFRHTFATRCIEAGIKPKTLQAYLGHASLSMTMDLYVHNTDENKKTEINLLENELNELCISDDDINDKFNKIVQNNEKIVTMPGVNVV